MTTPPKYAIMAIPINEKAEKLENAMFYERSKPFTISNQLNMQSYTWEKVNANDHEDVEGAAAFILVTRLRDIDKKYKDMNIMQYMVVKSVKFENQSLIISKYPDYPLIWEYTLDPMRLITPSVNGEIFIEAADKEAIIPKTKTPLPSINRDMTQPELVATFQKYIYFLFRQPFMFKLNALTVNNIHVIMKNTFTIKSAAYKIDEFLKPLLQFSYIKINFKQYELDDLLSGDIIMVDRYNRIIETDSTTYNNIFGTTNMYDTYIHILHFIDLVNHILEKVFKLNENAGRPERFGIFFSNAVDVIFARTKDIPKIYNLIKNTLDTIVLAHANIPLKAYINILIAKQYSNDVITYLKINNTEPGLSNEDILKYYNKRYNIKLNQVRIPEIGWDMQINKNAKVNYISTSMLLETVGPVQIPFYKIMDDNTVAISQELIDYSKSNANTHVKTNVTSRVSPNVIPEITSVTYQNKYLFGNYNRVFPLSNVPKPNERTSNEMTEVIEQICTKNRPVFLLGYGASGSGKTASLIHLKARNGEAAEDGIIVHLCKKIAETGINNKSPARIVVNIKEFYSEDGKMVEKTREPIEFTMRDGVFVANTSAPGTITYNHPESVEIASGNKDKTYSMTNHTLGEVLKELVDVDRLVRATTNNPQSSRSHVLIFIHFYSDAKSPENPYLNSLVVGDLAGKENEFKCADINTIISFLNKQIVNRGAENDGKPFYGVYADIDHQGKDDIQNSYRKADLKPVYKFTAPYYSGHLVKNENTDPHINYITKLGLCYRNLLLPAENKSKCLAASIIKVEIKDNEVYAKMLELSSSKFPVPPVVKNKLIDYVHDKFRYTNPTYAGNYSTDILTWFMKEYVFGNDEPDESIEFSERLLGTIKYMKKVYNDNTTDTKKKLVLFPNAPKAKHIEPALTDMPLKLNPKYLHDKDYYNLIFSATGIKEAEKNYKFNEYVNAITNIITSLKDPANSTIYVNTAEHRAAIISEIMKYMQTITNKPSSKPIPLSKTYTFVILDKVDDYYIPVIKKFNVEDLARTFFIGNRTALYSYYKVHYAPRGYDNNDDDDKISPVYIKLFANIMNALDSEKSTRFYEYVGLFDQIGNIITETIERIAYGAKICDERLAEGQFINTSLDTMRTTIKDILMKKHEQRGTLYFSPNFIDECLVSYCPSGVNCFKTSANLITPAIRPSFNLIETVGKGIILAKYGKEASSVTMEGELNRVYKDIALCIFGVFNVSRLADNPPSVPYIDINNLKRLFYDSGDKYAADDMFRESYPVHVLLIDLKNLLEASKLTQSTFYELLTDILKLEGIHDVVAAELVESKTNELTQIYNMIKQLITKIDIHNAASSIGTLETLNTIAMLDVNTLCNKHFADDSKKDTSNRNLYFTTDNSQINDLYK